MSNAALFLAGTDATFLVPHWNVADQTALAALTPVLSDIGKIAYVDDDGGLYVLQTLTGGVTPVWKLDPALRLSVEGPIVVDGNTTANYPAWHGRRIRVTAAADIAQPANAPVGFIYHLLRDTADAVNIVATGDLTLDSTVGADTDVTITDQFGWVSVSQEALNRYFVVGGISAIGG